MPLLKDLVPGSRSDRLSFHSDTFSFSEDQQQEKMEEGAAPARPNRGFTPKRSTPGQPTVESKGTTRLLVDPSRVRSKEKGKSGESDIKAERLSESTNWYTGILSIFSTIINFLWRKLKGAFKEEVGMEIRKS